MKMKETLKARTQKFLKKHFTKSTKGWSYNESPDLRQQGKVTHPMTTILWALELGMLSCQQTLRDVEEMTENLGAWARGLVPDKISDTTLDTEAQRLDTAWLLEKLILRVRDFHRSKMLDPVDLPCGVVTVDGKNLATLDHSANETAQKRSKKNEKWHRSSEEETRDGKSYFLMPALRAVLTSAAAKVCIYQLALSPRSGESTMFPAFLKALKSAYGRNDMFRIIDVDAGLTSWRNANLVIKNGYDYVFGLKGNQQELFSEANLILLEKAKSQAPEVETPWEKRNGKQMRRTLWRTDEMAGMENSVGKWSHLSQTWLVRQETRNSHGKIEVEDRLFLTSLLWDYLKPMQILTLIRNHWGVENNCFNTLDLQWREDSAPWCTQGEAIWNLGLLRIMAYNTVQILRCRRLRPKKPNGTRQPLMSWRSLFKIIEKSFELEVESFCTG